MKFNDDGDDQKKYIDDGDVDMKRNDDGDQVKTLVIWQIIPMAKHLLYDMYN